MKKKSGVIGIVQSFKKYINYGSIDVWFLIIVLLLVGIGLTMMFSASYPYALTYKGDSLYYIKSQGLYAVVGIIAMFIISHIKVDILKTKLALNLMWIGSTFFLVIVFFLPQVKAGFYRWIKVGSLGTFQPSEITKFVVIVVGAYFYSKYANKMSSTKPYMFSVSLPSRFRHLSKIINAIGSSGKFKESWVPTWPHVIFFGISAYLVYKENHLSGCILIFAIGVVMMYLGGVRGRWFAVGFAVVAVAVIVICIIAYIAIEQDNEVVLSFLKDYQGERIIAWLDKDYDPKGSRWQTNQALYAIGSGGLFGKGLGNSTQKYLYVSEPQNDMIFSIVCEELGFIGAAFIVALFVLLVLRGVVIGINAKTRFALLLTMGIVFHVGLQVLLNIAVATDSMPNTGISLPFFSAGGTSLLMLLGEMGVVLSVSRSSRVKKK